MDQQVAVVHDEPDRPQECHERGQDEHLRPAEQLADLQRAVDVQELFDPAEWTSPVQEQAERGKREAGARGDQTSHTGDGEDPLEQKAGSDHHERDARRIEDLDVLEWAVVDEGDRDQAGAHKDGQRPAPEQRPPEGADRTQRAERDPPEEHQGMAVPELLERSPRDFEWRHEQRDHAGVFLLALVEVADRGHDVEAAHAVGRERHHDERQQDAEADGDHHARPLDVERERDALVEAAEDARQHADHQRGDADPEQRPDHARGQRVSGAFEQEHLGQVPALEADRAAHAHLGAALGGEHDEDQEDEQHAHRDRKEAHPEQRGGDEQAARLREHDGVGLVGRVRVEVEAAGDVVEAGHLRRRDRGNAAAEGVLQVRVADQGLEVNGNVRLLDLHVQRFEQPANRIAVGKAQSERGQRSCYFGLRQQRFELTCGGGVHLQDADELEQVVLAGGAYRRRHRVAHDAFDQAVAGQRLELVGNRGLVQLDQEAAAEVLRRVEE